MNRTYSAVLFSLACAGVILGLSEAQAQVAPPLGAAGSFAVLGGSTVTNTGSSVINGDVGVSPGTSIVGFPPGIVTGGSIHVADATAAAAQSAVTAAYTQLGTQACTSDLTGQNLGGKTLTSGVYCFSTSAQLTGLLRLNAQGNPNTVWVFRIGSTLTTASGASVEVINGGSPCNVFWRVGSSATLGTGTSFGGNILAMASITLNTSASAVGRMLARSGAVTLDTNNITRAPCGSPVPTLPQWGVLALAGALLGLGYYRLRRRPADRGQLTQTP